MSNHLTRDQRFKAALFDSTPVQEKTVDLHYIEGQPYVWLSNVKRTEVTRFLATTTARNLVIDRPKATPRYNVEEFNAMGYVGIWKLHEL